jgi:hypothetical protein
MLMHYLLLSLKVLQRRTFFTFVSIFGISFTLLVLMVITALADQKLAPMAPETRQRLTLEATKAILFNDNDRGQWCCNASFEFFDAFARDLPGVERLSIFSDVVSGVSYREGRKVTSALKRTDGEFWNILSFSFLEGRPYTHRKSIRRRTSRLSAPPPVTIFMRSFADVFRLPPPAKQPEPVLSLLEDNVRLISPRDEAKAVAWRWDADARDLRVPMDRGQMDQAFLNILQNAVDATGGHGTITIRLQAANGGRPRVMIEDSGPGLTREAQANLFTPFFSTKPDGQGIGLTLVQEILAGHGFDYSLERPPGEPTRFTIVF